MPWKETRIVDERKRFILAIDEEWEVFYGHVSLGYVDRRDGQLELRAVG